jgi:hypothetical protein
MHIWQVMVWCGAGSHERPPEHLLAVLAEEGALIEVVLHEAFQRIQQEIGSELNPALVHAEVINAVIKEHWTLDQGVLHARTSPVGEI